MFYNRFYRHLQDSTYGRLLLGDEETTQKELRHIIRESKQKRNVVVPMTSISRRRELVKNTFKRIRIQAVLDSGAVPNPLSCNWYATWVSRRWFP